MSGGLERGGEGVNDNRGRGKIKWFGRGEENAKATLFLEGVEGERREFLD